MCKFMHTLDSQNSLRGNRTNLIAFMTRNSIPIKYLSKALSLRTFISMWLIKAYPRRILLQELTRSKNKHFSSHQDFYWSSIWSILGKYHPWARGRYATIRTFKMPLGTYTILACCILYFILFYWSFVIKAYCRCPGSLQRPLRQEIPIEHVS